jgi:hypothetical protein
LISNMNFADSESAPVSATIGIDWAIFYVIAATAWSARPKKKTVSLERSSVEQHRYAVSAGISARPWMLGSVAMILASHGQRYEASEHDAHGPG